MMSRLINRLKSCRDTTQSTAPPSISNMKFVRTHQTKKCFLLETNLVQTLFDIRVPKIAEYL